MFSVLILCICDVKECCSLLSKLLDVANPLGTTDGALSTPTPAADHNTTEEEDLSPSKGEFQNVVFELF